MNIKKINLSDINFKEYTKYNFPYVNKRGGYRDEKKQVLEMYYNDKSFIKIYKPNNNDRLSISFIENNIDIFKELCPAVTDLIYNNNKLVGYITIRGKDLNNDEQWGCGDKNKTIFFNFLNKNKKILLKLLHERKYFYTDIKPKNIIKFKNKEGKYRFSFIDLENFVKLPVHYKFQSRYLKHNHWYLTEVNKYYVEDKN